MTPAAAETKARQYIATDHKYAADVCTMHNQIYENVKHTVWFRDMLAAQLLEDYNDGSV